MHAEVIQVCFLQLGRKPPKAGLLLQTDAYDYIACANLCLLETTVESSSESIKHAPPVNISQHICDLLDPYACFPIEAGNISLAKGPFSFLIIHSGRPTQRPRICSSLSLSLPLHAVLSIDRMENHTHFRRRYPRYHSTLFRGQVMWDPHTHVVLPLSVLTPHKVEGK